MVYEDILRTEAKERSMLLWLRNLRIHSFEPRHFENISPQHLDNVIRIPSLNSRNSVEGQTVQNTLNIEEKQSKTICDEEVKSTVSEIQPHHKNVILDEETEPMPKRTKEA